MERLYLIPFLHQTTTLCRCTARLEWLYLIPFLHQTTTMSRRSLCLLTLYLIPFLHQTTTFQETISKSKRCILFHFYIKPQLGAYPSSDLIVVSYSISTSNHNLSDILTTMTFVVSYSISTSNHNAFLAISFGHGVVSYSISTSNHNTLQR